MLLLKPWKAKDPNSKRYMGVGAFNLVKSTVYKAIDGHKTIAMHPIDDVMLGKMIKHSGFSQDCLLGHNFIQAEWYVTVCEFINGLMKNTFAFYNYNMANVLLGVLIVVIINILPLLAFFLLPGLPVVFSGLRLWSAFYLLPMDFQRQVSTPGIRSGRFSLLSSTYTSH